MLGLCKCRRLGAQVRLASASQLAGRDQDPDAPRKQQRPGAGSIGVHGGSRLCSSLERPTRRDGGSSLERLDLASTGAARGQVALEIRASCWAGRKAEKKEQEKIKSKRPDSKSVAQIRSTSSKGNARDGPPGFIILTQLRQGLYIAPSPQIKVSVMTPTDAEPALYCSAYKNRTMLCA